MSRNRHFFYVIGHNNCRVGGFMFYRNKKIKYLLFLCIFFVPFYIKSYSDYIIASGENVGIKLNSDGVIIIDTYDINGIDTVKGSGLEIGDVIKKVNDKKRCLKSKYPKSKGLKAQN